MQLHLYSLPALQVLNKEVKGRSRLYNLQTPVVWPLLLVSVSDEDQVSVGIGEGIAGVGKTQ